MDKQNCVYNARVLPQLARFIGFDELAMVKFKGIRAASAAINDPQEGRKINHG